MPTSDSNILIRAAAPSDIPAMLTLLEPDVQQKTVLRRTPEDLLACLGNFLLAADRASGALLALGALRPYGNGIFEVRSLAVACSLVQTGIGTRLVQALLEKGRAMAPPARCVFALTKAPAFFERLGFSLAAKEKFPDKIWLDCRACPKRDCCDEVAVEYLL